MQRGCKILIFNCSTILICQSGRRDECAVSKPRAAMHRWIYHLSTLNFAERPVGFSRFNIFYLIQDLRWCSARENSSRRAVAIFSLFIIYHATKVHFRLVVKCVYFHDTSMRATHNSGIKIVIIIK